MRKKQQQQFCNDESTFVTFCTCPLDVSVDEMTATQRIVRKVQYDSRSKPKSQLPTYSGLRVTWTEQTSKQADKQTSRKPRFDQENVFLLRCFAIFDFFATLCFYASMLATVDMTVCDMLRTKTQRLMSISCSCCKSRDD